MEKAELDALISTPEELVKQVKDTRSPAWRANILQWMSEYEPEDHKVMKAEHRPEKIVDTDEGLNLQSPVTRISIPLQKQIVALAAAFLCGNPIKLEATTTSDAERNFMAVIQRSWDSNKLNYETKSLVKTLMSEGEVAELWYTEDADKRYWRGTVSDKENVTRRLRMRMLSNKAGDDLYPVWSASGDMIAFGRGYLVREGDKEVEHLDVYTSKITYKLIKRDQWDVKPETNITGKIPVIYYKQTKAEWSDVQTAIDRVETLVSNLGDSNDYSAFPILMTFGEVNGWAQKGERGKAVEMAAGADARYLESNTGPQAVEIEYKILRSLVLDMTQTPDISIEQMKSVGADSSLALKMLFLAAHMKAADKEEIVGKGIQRRINFMKDANALINTALEADASLEISPKFEPYLPKNEQEMINMLSVATGASATMSVRTAVANNPLVKNVDDELELMKKDGLNREMNDPIV